MPGAVRLGDICTGHGCFSPRPVVSGNLKVIIDGKPACTIGDVLVPHCCGPICHPGNIASGSFKVIIGGRPAASIGDVVSCGSFMATGSLKVRLDESSGMTMLPSTVTTESGEIINLPASYQGYATTQLIESAGRYAVFDEEDEIQHTPTTIKTDTPSTPINESVIKDDTKTVPQEIKIVDDCKNITEVDYAMKLSTNFTLANFTTKSLFSHTLQPQAGFTTQQLICNLQGLSKNVLENIWLKYPGFRINSGFRTFTVGKSQHEKGMACDIQWSGISPAEYKIRANWIRDNIIFDQLLFEHGNNIWIHVSFNRNNNTQRKDVKTMFKGKFEPGIVLYY